MRCNHQTGYFARILICIFSLTCFYSCHRKADQPGAPAFSHTPEYHQVHPLSIVEASGIADSKANPGYLWVLEDSGNPAVLYLLKHDGTVAKTMIMRWMINYDWEDITLAPGPEPGKNYLYIADIGDNTRRRKKHSIYRFEEPKATTDTVFEAVRIQFVYPDGKYDAEALLVDPDTKDIFIITKKDERSKIYRLAYPYGETKMNTVEEVGELPYNFVVSAAISPTGRDIVVKTYGDIFYYPHKTGESILQSLSRAPLRLPYQPEPQGEAISFATDNSGYFTLSEKGLALSMKLYFYKRK